MKFKSTLILFIVLLIIALYTFLHDIPEQKRKEEKKEREEKIVFFEKEDLKSFALKFPSEKREFLLEKRGDQWFISKPVNTLADKSVVDGIINRLNGATTTRVIDEDPKDLSQYGIDKPSMIVDLKFSGSAEAKSLLFGNETVVGYSVYFKRGDEKQVLIAGSYLKSDLNKKLFDLRDKKIFDLRRDKLKKIGITYGNTKINLGKAADKKWYIKSPVEAPADEKRVLKLINYLDDGKIEKFFDTPTPSVIHGMKNPVLSLDIVEEGGEDKNLIILENPDKKGSYLGLIREKGGFFIASQEMINEVKPSIFELRSKLIFDLPDISKISRVVLKEVGRKLEISKTNKDVWHIEAPFKGRADSIEVDKFIFALKDLESMQYIQGEKLSIDNLIDKELEIWTEGEDKPQHIALLKKRLSDAGIYGYNLSNKDEFFIISEKALEKISKSPLDLREKFIWKFREDKVNKVSINYRKKEYIFEKDGVDWSVVSPYRYEVDEVKMRNILFLISGLKFVNIIDKGDDSIDYGFTSPESVITLWGKDETLMDRLVFGKGTGDEMNSLLYSKLESKDQIFMIKMEFLEEIPTVLDALR